jgi:putative hemolysin
VDWLKKKAIDKTLDLIAAFKGLPRYLKRNEELKTTGHYLNYRNFGEMGIAEIGISVRYNKTNLDALNTGRPLIIVANHHLGLADGLALQYLAGQVRQNSPTLLLLARWIEKIMPHAVFGDQQRWGTAIPVEINTPKKSDPLYDQKMAEVKAFNAGWTRTSSRVLRNGGALIVFPAGHVASINDDGGKYPESVYDAPDSWQEGFLNLARLGKADLVFAKVDSVNSEAFYRDRKRFGGGDKERVIWFFSEALAKKDKTIDIGLSKPMSLDEVYEVLARNFGSSKEALVANPTLAAELMRKFTYRLTEFSPQTLETLDSPQKIPSPVVAW